MARTDSLSNYLTDVATAIKNKKGDQTAINAANFDTEIANLPSGTTYPFDVNYLIVIKRYATNDDITAITNYVNNMSSTDRLYLDDGAFMSGSFTGDISAMAGTNATYSNTKLGIKGLKPINASTGGQGGDTFSNCGGMTVPPYINFSECMGYNNMFKNCIGLVSFPSNYFYTIPKKFKSGDSEGTYPPITTTGMFNGCTNLTTVDFSETIYPVAVNNMFQDCASLTSVSRLNVGLAYSTNSLFKDCYNLTTIGITDMHMTTNTGAVFGGCFNLDDASLDNALLALSTVTLERSGRRSLSRVFTGTSPNGVPTYAFAQRVRACSHYQDAVNNGFTDNLPTS